MDFIISLAHFCEDHGPTSILCTQVIPPACTSCYPHTALNTIARTPSNGSSSTPPQSSHGLGSYRRGDGRSGENTPASSPRIHSPSDTPPSSPRGGIPSLPTPPTSAGPAAQDVGCKSCSITIPQKINAAGTTAPGGRDGKPRFRTTESFPVSNYMMDEGDAFAATPTVAGGADSSATSTSSRTSSSSAGTHTHTITYISCRAPTLAQRYSTVRQACVRTLNCEVTQTGPIMFGDHLAGYTIAFVFKISDAKARGGRRTYAFLCMSPHQKALIHSWSLITATFQSMVNEIQHAVAEKAARESSAQPGPISPTASVASRGPEGFLRRRAAGDGGAQRSLADLTGTDNIFLAVHTKFVQLLSSLTKLHGFATAGYDSPLPPPAIGLDGRSRAGSVGSVVTDEPRVIGQRTQSPRGLEKEMRQREMDEGRTPTPASLRLPATTSAPSSSSSSATPTPGNTSGTTAPQAGKMNSTPPPKDGLTPRRQVAVG